MTFSTKTPANRTNPIRRPLMALALILPVAAGGFTPAFAEAPADKTMEQRAERGERGFRPPMAHDREMRRHHMGRHHGMRHGRPPFSDFVAMKLAAAEQAAGIKSAQLDAWRTFSAALVDFTTFERPPRGPAGAEERPDGAPEAAPGDAAPDGIVDDGTEPDDATDGNAEAETERRGPRGRHMRERSGFDMLDRVIAMSEQRAEKAATLKTALADLEAVLEPEQREKLDKLLLPPKHMMRHMRQMRR